MEQPYQNYPHPRPLDLTREQALWVCMRANQGTLQMVIILCALTSGVHTFLPVRVRVSLETSPIREALCLVSMGMYAE